MINDWRVPVLSSAIDFLFELEPRPTLRGLGSSVSKLPRATAMRALSEVRKEQLVGFFSCCVAAQLPRRMESMRLLVAYFGYAATRTQSVCVRLCTGLSTLELTYRAKTCGCGFAFPYEFGSLTSAPAPGKQPLRKYLQ